MNILDKYNKIKEKVIGIESDVDKVINNNSAAGGRARKALQEIKVMAQELRIEIQHKRNEKGS